MNKALLLVVATVYAYDQSIEDCEEFAALWGNSCSVAVTEGSNILTADGGTELTCSGEDSWCVGEDQDDDAATDECVYSAWVCVTCSTVDDEVFIRMQSNNMPSKCWQTSESNPNVADYVTVDYTVTWNADMTDILNYE
jgi:hypothetical protein